MFKDSYKQWSFSISWQEPYLHLLFLQMDVSPKALMVIALEKIALDLTIFRTN